MKDNSKATRTRRAAEAKERQAAYSALTDEQKVVSIVARPGRSLKELTRLDVHKSDYVLVGEANHA